MSSTRGPPTRPENSPRDSMRLEVGGTPQPSQMLMAAKWTENTIVARASACSVMGLLSLAQFVLREPELAEHLVRVLPQERRRPPDAHREIGHLPRGADHLDCSGQRMLGLDHHVARERLRIVE